MGSIIVRFIDFVLQYIMSHLVISSFPGTMWASITLASINFRSITSRTREYGTPYKSYIFHIYTYVFVWDGDGDLFQVYCKALVYETVVIEWAFKCIPGLDLLLFSQPVSYRYLGYSWPSIPQIIFSTVTKPNAYVL